ncbi:MAG: amidase [Chloroflexi bacterium]|nr:amidase [Chloroflexota bacterium]
MTAFPEYAKYDGLGLADLVRKKEVSAVELVDEAIQRIEAHNPQLNAVVTKLYDTARDAASKSLPDSPFAGVPFLIKDLMATIAGVPTSSGNKLWKNIPAKVDSELVQRWKKAGVIILGKTNTPEFGLTPYTEPGAFGAAHNPWDLSRTPGGSSGGSAASVSARIVPMASGGDGGGSIRIPASACGLFGLKPTRGRTPTGPAIGEAWHGFAIEHVLTRSVRDSAAMLDATQGADIGAPYYAPAQQGTFLQEVSTLPGKLRIAFTGKPMLGKNVQPEVLKGLEDTIRLLKELGHEVVEAAPEVDGETFSLAFVTILAAELRADIEEAAAAAGKKVSVQDYDPSSFGLGMLGKAMSAHDYASAARYLQVCARQIAAFFEGYDLLLTPTLSQLPVKIGALQPSASEKSLINVIGSLDAGWLLKAMGIIKPLAAQTFDFIPWTPVFNVTGQPAMSVPLFWSADGLPVGMHFVSKFGDEATLFRLAGQLEQARPWADRVPSGF